MPRQNRNFLRCRPLLVALFACAAFVTGIAGRASAGEPLSFSRDVLPILSNNCFACHGPDKHEANLRLDLREVATKPAKSGDIALVPGKTQESALVKRIASSDPDEKMPPVKSTRKLTPQQVEILTRWVAEGAPYTTHWAFVPPTTPQLPAVKQESWCRNPIDRFVLAKLEAEGLSPSPEADKVTLLRRLYLDLIGLPPTIAQVDEYLKDSSPDAYQKQVEKLLDSPHYGEYWGRHWLDAARYADSDGFEKDKPRYIWFYRDYVINAFNKDIPYNQFVVDQLAGDELPHPTQDQIVATGFLRNSMLNEEGGADPEQFRMDEMFDRIDAIGKSILGVTIQCAQCHNHKYDPIAQEDYYRLFAFLNNDDEAQPVVYTTAEQAKIAELKGGMEKIEADLKREMPDWEIRLTEWEQNVESDHTQWTVLPLENKGDNAQRYLPQKDGSYIAQGYAPTKHTAVFAAKTDLAGITGLRLELLTDPNLPAGGPGRSLKGTCALTDISLEVSSAKDLKKKTKVKFTSATSDYDQPVADLEPTFYDKTNNKRVTGPVKFAIDGDDKTAWGIDAGPGRRNQDRKAVFACEKPIGEEAGSILTISLKQDHGGWNSDDLMTNNLGRFRISATTQPSPAADPLPANVREAIEIPKDQRSPQQVAAVFSFWRTTVPEWKEANERIESLWQQWPAGTTSLTLRPRPQGRETHVLARGDWLKPGRAVTPGVPASLGTLPASADGTRLTLARWLVDRKAPTTARVFVNRIWQSYFGTGIVATPEDFGLQGQAPSHPALLDWLACQFMDGGWSVKQMQRLIVNSATYRQNSRVTPDLVSRDPYNRLLARGPRFRVEGETVRDIALSTSGLLNEEVGGRTVMPPAPAFLFLPPSSYAPFPWIDETGPQKYRRALYTFRRRSTAYPVLQAFDVPVGDSACVRRQRSNSPLQALTSLNEPMFVECAQVLARETLVHGGTSDDQRIDYAFRRVLSRPPAPAEMDAIRTLLGQQRQRFVDGGLNPSEVVAGSKDHPANIPPGATAAEWASYTVVARVVLNLDEAITKE